jgi:hypothetical protein
MDKNGSKKGGRKMTYAIPNALSFNDEKKKDNAFFLTIKFIVAVAAVITFAVGVAGLVVTIVFSVQALRTRYDSAAVAGGGLEYTFRSGASNGTGTFTASAGQLRYSMEQTQGNNAMMYEVAMKRNNVASWTIVQPRWTFPANNRVYGPFVVPTSVALNNRTQAYDVRINKLSHVNTASRVLFVWTIA